MRKIEVLKRHKEILQNILNDINNKTSSNYSIKYHDYYIEILKNNIHIHSFTEPYDNETVVIQYVYYYLKGLQENL